MDKIFIKEFLSVLSNSPALGESMSSTAVTKFSFIMGTTISDFVLESHEM